MTTVPPSGTIPGTVIIETPPLNPVTSTRQYTGTSILTGPITVTTIPASGTVPGTVIIETPPPVPTVPAFDCDEGGYLIQSRALYRLDLATGDSVLARDPVGPGSNINAMGYNILDNLIWGMLLTDTFPVIQIAADGSTIEPDINVGRPDGPPTGIWQSGDVDPDGNFWISFSGRAWVRIDANPASSTYRQILQRGTSVLEDNIADWTYVAGGGRYLYSLGFNSALARTRLLRWSIDTFTWEVLRNFGNVVGSNAWGAMYAVSEGIFYASENISGDIYQFDINSGPPVRINSSPATGSNDGAHCIAASPPG